MAYVPLKSLLLEVDGATAALLERLARGPVEAPRDGEIALLDALTGLGVLNGSPDRWPAPADREASQPRAVTLLPSNRCTLACRYCYSESASCGSHMSLEMARAAVDLVLAAAGASGERIASVMFHGGGEPTQNWEVLTGVHAYALARASAHRMVVRCSLCTNGMVSDEQAAWIAAAIGSITVSVDGDPEAHDPQRPTAGGGPSFDRVARTLDILRSRSRSYDLRMTVSSATAERLPELYTFLADRFLPARISAEPLFPSKRSLNAGMRPPEATVFVKALEQTLEIAAQRGIPFTYAGGRLSRLDTCFCGANGRSFIVTPSGRVTACLEVTADEDPRGALFFYGEYRSREGRFVFDRERFRRLCGIPGPAHSECSHCFARWHCAGDCPAKTPNPDDLAGARNRFRCTVNQAVLRKQLELALRGVAEIPASDRSRREELPFR
jgi:uncharacterized protein